MANRESFSQLDAAGNATVNTGDSKNHTVQVTVANVNTSVDFSVEGSVDGVNFFKMSPDRDSVDAGVSGISESNGTFQATANGTYYLNYRNTHIGKIKLVFETEAGGTTATLDGLYLGE